MSFDKTKMFACRSLVDWDSSCNIYRRDWNKAATGVGTAPTHRVLYKVQYCQKSQGSREHVSTKLWEQRHYSVGVDWESDQQLLDALE